MEKTPNAKSKYPVVAARVTKSQRKQLMKLAKQAGVKLSTYVKDVIVGHLEER